MKRGILLLVVFVLLVELVAFGQCSQCKLLAEQSGAEDDAILGVERGNNINAAILYIMTVPYIILGFLFRKQIKNLFTKKAV